jgi:SAM-dependent methyltransferase
MMHVVLRPITYGADVSDDAELRLCGDLVGKRALELGISSGLNAVALAERGAKAIAVDPDAARIAHERQEADAAGVRVEFHHGDVADLGFATSASVDLVVAAGTLADVDDLPRVLRQVHRVLKPEHPLVLGVPHPVAAMLDGAEVVVRREYGAPPTRSIAALFMALHRANFRVDNVHELFPSTPAHPLVPTVLVMRARKLGV